MFSFYKKNTLLIILIAIIFSLACSDTSLVYANINIFKYFNFAIDQGKLHDVHILLPNNFIDKKIEFNLYLISKDPFITLKFISPKQKNINITLNDTLINNEMEGMDIVLNKNDNINISISILANKKDIKTYNIKTYLNNSIKNTLRQASSGDIIIVTPGIYCENNIVFNKKLTLQSINPKNNNIQLSTIINGEEKDSIIKFNNAASSGSIFTGFTIQNGNSGLGGAIYICNSSPNIMNNIITNNSSTYQGGGIYICGGSPMVINNIISNNFVADYGGGGIYIAASSPFIADNIISHNSSKGNGGGIYVYDYSSPIIKNNIISDNLSKNNGGGISIYDYCSPIIKNNQILKNTSLNCGGGIYMDWNMKPIITDNIISGNLSKNNGGGIAMNDKNYPIINDNIINKNSKPEIFYLP